MAPDFFKKKKTQKKIGKKEEHLLRLKKHSRFINEIR